MTPLVKNIIANGLVIALLSLLMFTASTWWRMNSQYNQGESALRAGNFAGAVAGFESSLHMYVPWHPTIGKAAEKLWQLGETNERLGDVTRALISYRALRSSFHAAHWITTPGTAWVAKCDKKIAALVPMQQER